MTSRTHRFARGGLVATLLSAAVLTYAGCDGSGPAPGLHDDSVDTVGPVELTESAPVPQGAEGCSVQAASDITAEEAITKNVGPNGRLGGLAVDRDGTATLVWSDEAGGRWGAWAADVPLSEVGPQRLPALPPRQLPAGAAISDHFPDEDSLHVDGAGVRTAMWLEDVRLADGQNTESYDLAVADRSSTGWSSPTVLANGSTYLRDLSVARSGAAVVLWQEYEDRDFHYWLAVRPGRGAPWAAGVPVPPGEGVPEVEIDDAGRVWVAYNFDRRRLTMWRLGLDGRWGRHAVGGPRSELSDWAVGPDGAIVVAFSRGPRGHNATARMSPSGTWSAPVLQPGAPGFPGPTVDIDGLGRALWAAWDDGELVVRSSGPRGRWRRPCVLADHIRNPRYYDDVTSQLLVNRRGDAVATWRSKVETPRLWVSYRPAGEDWTQPVYVSAKGAQPPDVYRVAIGDRGHAAVAWVSRNSRQISIVRLEPAQ